MGVISNPGGFLLSGTSASGGGTPLDCRAAYGAYFHLEGSANSAVVDLQATPTLNGARWLTFATYTASATYSAAFQHTAYYPFVRAAIRTAYGGGDATGFVYAFWHPIA